MGPDPIREPDEDRVVRLFFRPYSTYGTRPVRPGRPIPHVLQGLGPPPPSLIIMYGSSHTATEVFYSPTLMYSSTTTNRQGSETARSSLPTTVTGSTSLRSGTVQTLDVSEIKFLDPNRESDDGEVGLPVRYSDRKKGTCVSFSVDGLKCPDTTCSLLYLLSVSYQPFYPLNSVRSD